MEAGVKGNKLENGMLFDFTILKKELKGICDEFDHKFLNELEEFKELPPTAENIGRVIYEKIEELRMHGLLGVGLPLEEKQRTKIFFLILCESLSQSASRETKF
ncbi:6-carboxytetrahydropterin synthase [Clostridium sp.]|uniref:6-pyruvoyl trahydropterin synthase family protein n=1 Tax=Clostridium sp. TaxID=1506 RepID=UPI00258D1CB3|nr:6-carboxytetrahydropterin synthase [Clostridium sp.]MDF2506080.1 queuosine biosynthesis protein QueD [Clostridium sp.]